MNMTQKKDAEAILQGIEQFCDEILELSWKAINSGIITENSMLVAYYKGTLDNIKDIKKIIKEGSYKSIIEQFETEIKEANKTGVETQ